MYPDLECIQRSTLVFQKKQYQEVEKLSENYSKTFTIGGNGGPTNSWTVSVHNSWLCAQIRSRSPSF